MSHMRPCQHGLKLCVKKNHQQLCNLKRCLFIEGMSWLRMFGYYSECSGIFILVLEHSDITNQLYR
ncbi:hypothetical protein AHAS_Ahas01G0015100 [Arachis hypogaea]